MKKYFLFQNGMQQGPFSFDELRMMNISPQSSLWFAGMTGWKQAHEIPELQSLFNATQNFPQQHYFPPPQNYFPPPNYSPRQNGKIHPGGWIAIGGGIFVVLLIIVFLLVSKSNRNDDERRNYAKMMVDDQMRADSTRMADSVSAAQLMQPLMDTLSTVVDTAMNDDDGLSNIDDTPADYYTGIFKNISGYEIDVSGADKSDLAVKIVSCNGSTDATGDVTAKNSMTVSAVGGCTLTIFYVNDKIISVSESNCDSDHGNSCTFSGAYQKE